MNRYPYNNRYEPELWLDAPISNPNPSFTQDEAKYFTGQSRHSSYNQQPNNAYSGWPPRSSSHSIGTIPFGHDYHRGDTHNRRQSTITPARHASIPAGHEHYYGTQRQRDFEPAYTHRQPTTQSRPFEHAYHRGDHRQGTFDSSYNYPQPITSLARHASSPNHYYTPTTQSRPARQTSPQRYNSTGHYPTASTKPIAPDMWSPAMGGGRNFSSLPMPRKPSRLGRVKGMFSLGKKREFGKRGKFSRDEDDG
jgi:hypothetical protein